MATGYDGEATVKGRSRAKAKGEKRRNQARDPERWGRCGPGFGLKCFSRVSRWENEEELVVKVKENMG